MGLEIVREIARFRDTKTALLRHHLHVRLELFNKTGLEPIRQILTAGLADLFSVMDHSPQYLGRSYISYKSYVEKNSTFTAEELEAYTKAQWESPDAIVEEGKEADIILVRYMPGELPVVERAMVAGRWTFGIR